MTKATSEPVDPKIASDVDGDGALDLNPVMTQMTMVDLVVLDHKLRDEGSSLAAILRTLAQNVAGIRVR